MGPNHRLKSKYQYRPIAFIINIAVSTADISKQCQSIL